eukprot:TRINITY_DN15917_c0_g2_i3.p1 TRINITY_DN15917_c0_g2~~TRINITY_DN15917_c0_g2_i3.p1  ORF type:complete len:351 (-),score=58.74 TRINITY_DN15917_c0_g2_i3:95-1147(-)
MCIRDSIDDLQGEEEEDQLAKVSQVNSKLFSTQQLQQFFQQQNRQQNQFAQSKQIAKDLLGQEEFKVTRQTNNFMGQGDNNMSTSQLALVNSKLIIQQKPDISQIMEESQLNGSKLDSQLKSYKLMEQIFVFLGQVIRQKKIEILNRLYELEKKQIYMVMPRVGMSEDEFTRLRQKRRMLWSGFIEQDAFLKVLNEYEFKFCNIEQMQQFLQIMKCYNKKYKYVNYRKLFQNIYRRTSKFSQFTMQFQSKVPNLIKEQLDTMIDKSLPEKEQSQLVFKHVLIPHYYKYKEIQIQIKESASKSKMNYDDLLVTQEQQERNRLVRESQKGADQVIKFISCLLYTSPSPRDQA